MNRTIKNKTVFAFINLVCLFVTLVFPNSATPFSVIPVIASVSYWVYSAGSAERDSESKSDKYFNVASYFFLIIASILVLICCIVGFTHEINSEESVQVSTISTEQQSAITVGTTEQSDNSALIQERSSYTKYVITPKNGYGISVSIPQNYSTFAYFIIILVFVLSAGDIVCEFIHSKSGRPLNDYVGKSIFELYFHRHNT